MGWFRELVKFVGYMIGGLLCITIIGAPFGVIIIILLEILEQLEKQNKR